MEFLIMTANLGNRETVWVWSGRRLTSLLAIARETAAALENVSGSNLNRTMLLLHKLLIGFNIKVSWCADTLKLQLQTTNYHC